MLIDGDKLKINMEEWKSMLDDVFGPIIATLQEIMHNKKQITGKCTYLSLVGGLAESSYFQARMEEEFGLKSKYGLSIIVPKRPILSVVEGAAWFGAETIRTLSESISATFKAIVGLDFGTDGIGIAYGIGDKMFIHSGWESEKYARRTKRRTIILLDQNNDVAGFGMDGKETYLDLEEGANDWKLFENFKMQLYPEDHSGKDGKIVIRDLLTAANRAKFPSELIWIEVFKHINKLVTKYINEQAKVTTKGEIQWVISVPAIWNDDAKEKMKQWARRAGLVKRHLPNQCHIVYESDCAVLGMLSAAHDANDVEFKQNDKFMVIDAGGATVDFSCQKLCDQYENIGDYETEEIIFPSGGPWGSVHIDSRFIELLGEIFSKEWMDEFRIKLPHSFVDLKRLFQEAKEFFYKNKEDETHNCKLPMDFIEFMSEKFEAKCEDEDDEDENDLDDFIGDKAVMGHEELICLEYIQNTLNELNHVV